LKAIVVKSANWAQNHLLERLPPGSIVIHGGDETIEVEAKKHGFETRVYVPRGDSASDLASLYSDMFRKEHSDRDKVPVDLVLIFTHDLKRTRSLNDLVSKAKSKGVKTVVISDSDASTNLA